MKRTLSLLLALAMALSLVPAALGAESGIMSENQYNEQFLAQHPDYFAPEYYEDHSQRMTELQRAYNAYLLEAYSAAHPGELEGMSDEELLARKGGGTLILVSVEEYREKWGLDPEEVRPALMREYINNRLRVEKICANARSYQATYPRLWEGFDADVWFAQGNAAWWDQEEYWKVNGLHSREEFVALLFAEYVESGVWKMYGDKVEGTVPNPPSWMEQKDYLYFPGDPVYQPENWESVRTQREAAEKGGLLDYEGRDWAQGSPGQCYETALIRMKCAGNYGEDEFEAKAAFLSAGRAFHAAESGWYDQNRGRDETYYRLSVEKYRAYVLYHPAYSENLGRGLVPALDALNMTLEDFFAAPCMDRVSQADRAIVAALVAEYQESYDREKNRITVELDRVALSMDTAPQVRSQRVMVPIRAIAEALGADVEWDVKTNAVTLTRAGRTVTMTIGKTDAAVDGERLEMDVAPYADSNRTYVSARYVSEFFGQSVTWDGEGRRVVIAEDKTAAGDPGLEEWLLPMGSLLGFLEGGDPARFGFYARPPYTETTHSPNGVNENQAVVPRDLCREALSGTWGIQDREKLLETVEEILETGHDRDFQAAAKEVKNLSDREIARRTEKLSEVDQYMWPRTKALWKKWGKTGIRAWDLCRAAALAEWGYTAGYVTYPEALELLAPAVEELKESFDSWDEVYENFLESYYWCLREDLGDGTVWDTDLGMAWQYLKNSPDTRTLFDDSLFENRKD